MAAPPTVKSFFFGQTVNIERLDDLGLLFRSHIVVNFFYSLKTINCSKNMLKSLVKTATLLRPAFRNYSNVVAPTVSNTVLAEQFPAKYQATREIWVENINTIDEQKLDILSLHPDVFGAMPRIDLIHQNVTWQRKYRYVSFAHTKVRSEVAGGGRKPWPQKGIIFILERLKQSKRKKN